MRAHHYIAVDLGAGSGRVMLGTLADGRLTLEEVHRFPNGPLRFHGTLRWDVMRLWEDVKAGLRKVAARGLPIASISVDSWGVDYVLMNESELMLRMPFCYRDARTENRLPKSPRRTATRSTPRPARNFSPLTRCISSRRRRCMHRESSASRAGS